MDIIVSARHMRHVSSSMKEEVEARLSKMAKYAKITSAECVMDTVKSGSYAEIILHAKGIHLEAKSEAMDNLYDAIHQACDRMEKQLQRKHGKQHDHHSKHLGELEAELQASVLASEELIEFEDDTQENYKIAL